VAVKTLELVAKYLIVLKLYSTQRGTLDCYWYCQNCYWKCHRIYVWKRK